MTPCNGCPFVACRDCRWQGGATERDRRHMRPTDALWIPGESRVRRRARQPRRGIPMTHTIHSWTAGNPQAIHTLSTGELGGCSRGHLDLHQRKEGRMDLDNLFPRVPELDYAKRVDSCPECMTRHVTPDTVERVPNGAQCAYECPTCSCSWTTSWWEGEG